MTFSLSFFFLLHLLLFIYSPLVWEDEDASRERQEPILRSPLSLVSESLYIHRSQGLLMTKLLRMCVSHPFLLIKHVKDKAWIR